MSDASGPARDLELIEQFFREHRDSLIAIAHAVLRDRHEAEDTVQETMTAVWRRLPEIAADKTLPYLTHAVRQNAIRKKSRRREYASLTDCPESPGSLAGDSTRQAVDPVELEEAIGSLPLVQQSVLRMKYYFGMTFREIGASFSISTHTAASRCRHALRKLHSMLRG
jgi:RNA polymerase sigma factor (sigma-70 family)